MSAFSRLWSWFKRESTPIPAAQVSAPPRPKPVSAAKMSGLFSELLGLLKAGKPDRSMAAPIKVRSLKLPDPFPGVMPASSPKMAADSQIASVYQFGEQAGWDGYGFMGYALLAELAQIPEFRKPSEILANEMTRKWVKLISTGKEDKTEKLKMLEDELKRLGVQEAFRKAFEGDNFFGRMQIAIKLKGDTDESLKLPLVVDANIERDSLETIRVIEPIWTYPNDYNSVDPLADNFYRPQSWFVLSKQIHTTRLLTFISRPVPDILKPAYLFGGVSLTQLLQPYVENWLRTRQSVSNITHNFSTPVFKTDLGKLTEPGGAQLLYNRIAVFNTARDNQGAMVVDFKAEDFVNVSAPLSGLDKLQAQAQEQMASIPGIPLVKLFGITPSGLNASSDGEVRCFYDNCESAQERTGTPNLRRLLDIIQMSKFGAVDPDIGFVWQPLWSLDEKGLAEVRKINAETDCAYVDHGILDTIEVRQTVAAEENSRYASIEVDELPDPPPEEDDGAGEDDPEGNGPDKGPRDGDAPDVRDAPDARLRDSGEKKDAA
jgi:phage-related protein (TIGR01555 family)